MGLGDNVVLDLGDEDGSLLATIHRFDGVTVSIAIIYADHNLLICFAVVEVSSCRRWMGLVAG